MSIRSGHGLVIEPGILNVFRATVGAIWLLFTPFTFGLRSAAGNDPSTYQLIISWTFSGLLLIYLLLPWLSRRAPKTHLVLGLLAMSVVPIVMDTLVNELYLRARGSNPEELVNSGWLYLWLTPPLLLIAAQFRLREVLLFTFGTSLLAYLLATNARAVWGIDVTAPVNHAVIRLILYSIIGVIVVRIIVSQRTLRHELAEKNAQITELALRMEELTLARERNRLARELHDTLAHTLSAVEVQLKVIDMQMTHDPPTARRTLQETQTLAREGLREARRALHDLRASPIDEFGLLLAIKRLAERAADRTGAEATVVLPQHAPPLSHHQDQQLYRIIEEALNNVVRHARATRFTVVLETGREGVVVRVEDNGVGFDLDGTPLHHYGLHGMRERAGLIGAAIDVSGGMGRGTQIVVTIRSDT